MIGNQNNAPAYARLGLIGDHWVTLLVIAGVLFLLYILWEVRNPNPEDMVDVDVDGMSVGLGECCYHGITRYDEDWRMR